MLVHKPLVRLLTRPVDKIIVGGFMYFGLIVPAYGYGTCTNRLHVL